MYATEKYLKMEVKQLRELINELASDLGSDIKYLHSEITELQNTITELTTQLKIAREQADDES